MKIYESVAANVKTKIDAIRKLTDAGYAFHRHEPWGMTSGIDVYYLLKDRKERAVIRETIGGDWRIVFYQLTDAEVEHLHEAA